MAATPGGSSYVRCFGPGCNVVVVLGGELHCSPECKANDLHGRRVWDRLESADFDNEPEEPAEARFLGTVHVRGVDHAVAHTEPDPYGSGVIVTYCCGRRFCLPPTHLLLPPGVMASNCSGCQEALQRPTQWDRLL